MAAQGHRHTGSVSQFQNHKAQLATAYNELGKELSSHKIRVVGNYTLGKVIGEGAYGKVRMGVHRLTGTRVAIKQIPKEMSAALTREIHHHRQLHHPHVTQLYEVIATENNIWLVTELCSGGELFDYLAEKGRLGEEEVRVLFGQLCLAVAYVHGKGIVHRDLKLENVLLDERCRVKLGDFGFTREFERGSLLETFCGTTGYASPEMLLAKKYTGPEVDIWSLGVILYTLLTGTLPFDDDDDSVMRDKVIQGHFEDPEWLSNDVRDLIKKILVVDPTKRLSIAQILSHPWFTSLIPPSSPKPLSTDTDTLRVPTGTASSSQPPSASSAASDSTYHSASGEPFPSTPTTPDEHLSNDVFNSSLAAELKNKASELTLKKLTMPHPERSPQPETVHEETSFEAQESAPSRPSLSRATTNSSNVSNKGPPQYPVRTPARTKRRSVSSTLSDPSSPSASFEKPRGPIAQQDFSSLLSTPAPIIFSTSLERELLNNLSSLGFDTGQIVHSVLTDACDATGALWWMLKRKAERKLLEDPLDEPLASPEVFEEPKHMTIKGRTEKEKEKEEKKDRSLGRSAQPPSVASSSTAVPPSLAATHSAPELQFIPPTPTVATTQRPSTPPRATSPSNGMLSPSQSTGALGETPASRSHPSTPGSSIRDKDKDKEKSEHQGSKGRKNRAGSVSIMQRATTALEAAGLVRKKSAEAVRDKEDKEKEKEREKEKDREKSIEKRAVNSGDEPRASHGSGGSSKLAKSPPLKATIPATPPHSMDGIHNAPAMGSPWVITQHQHSPPPTPLNSPGDTLGSLPNIPEHSGKLGGHRNRASLLSAFRMWFREDAKGKRKEANAAELASSRNPGTSPVSARPGGRQTINRRQSRSKFTAGGGRKTTHRAKRASMSSRRSSSVNSKRSSIASIQVTMLDSSQYSAGAGPSSGNDLMTPVTSRRSFGSHTPNSEMEEFVSRPSSIQSFYHHRQHRKSPSASSAGSHFGGGRNSPLPPKYHRRAGSGSSTRVVRQMQPSNSRGSAHLRSNSASSNHSLASSRHGSLYDLSESESRRNSSPNKAHRSSLDDTPRRSTFIAQKRQTPFAHPVSSTYLNSIGRSSWKKSWGLEPPGWQSRTAHPTVEVLAILPPTDTNGGAIRDVFTGRQSLSMGDESDWVDEDDDVNGYVGGLGQFPSSISGSSSKYPTSPPANEGPLVSPPLRGSMGVGRQGPSTKRGGVQSLTPVSTSLMAQSRGKTGGRSPAGRTSPLPEPHFNDAPEGGRGSSRRQLPGRPGNAFRQNAIQEEEEDEE
ncbi:Pkinase-domain-containing protein [Panus rudis PR-1116 ss-1]|nr:Pkinase-domain-containing protein [Panus rudis PR-1116 ss-1]